MARRGEVPLERGSATSSPLARYRAFLLDVDGVLTRGQHALPGATAAVSALRAAGRLLVLTNNSTRARDELAAHLSSLGFDLKEDEVLGSAFLAARYLSLHGGPTCVWVLGEGGIRREMLLAGHQLAARPEEAQWVVVGMDRSLSYGTLADGLRAAIAGARILATNEDATFPTPTGLMPGAGALVGALRGMGFAPDVVVGKPAPAAFEVALDVLQLSRDDVLMIGDRLETDIAGAEAAGIDSALVLTGVCAPSDVGTGSGRPTWIASSLADLCAGRLVRAARRGGKSGDAVSSRVR